MLLRSVFSGDLEEVLLFVFLYFEEVRLLGIMTASLKYRYSVRLDSSCDLSDVSVPDPWAALLWPRAAAPRDEPVVLSVQERLSEAGSPVAGLG